MRFLTALTAFAILTLTTAMRADQPKDKAPDKPAWKDLFDGKSLEGWKAADYTNGGKVVVKDGALVMEKGQAMTGVVCKKADFPRMDYEVTFEGKKIDGDDFFCTTTFPVGKDHCSLVMGGWGGQVVGLSSLNFQDASENETTKSKEFKHGEWYKVRIRVTKNRIQAWIGDAKAGDKAAEQFVDVDTTDRKVGTRLECDACKPFGFCTWYTSGAVRNVRVRPLTPAEVKAAADTKPADKD